MVGKVKGARVNRAGLADTFGISLPTVDSWVRQGCPVLARGRAGREWEFSTADVAQWRTDKAVADATGGNMTDEAEIELRTKRAKMLQAELELAKARGDVAPVDEFERASAARYAMIRANCLNIPSRAVLQLLGETDESVFKRKLREEIVLALDTAANAELEIEQEEDSSPDE